MADYRLHSIPGYLGQLFIVEYTAGMLLLDGGSPLDAPRIEAFIGERLGRRMTELDLAVVTHMHPDHSSAAALLRERHGIPIAAPRALNYWYDGFWGGVQHLVDNLLSTYMAYKLGRPLSYVHHAKRIPIDFPLDDDDELPFFNDWRVLAVPGHTDHDIALYRPLCGTLYAADLVVMANHRYQLPFPVVDPVAMQHSLERIAALEPVRFLACHGGELDMTALKNALPRLSRNTRMPADHRGRRLRPLAYITPRAHPAPRH